MSIIVDAHCDLAWNIKTYGRDYTRSAAETRQAEKGTPVPEWNGDSLVGWPDYQRGRVAIVFSTLFASPARARMGDWDKAFYSDYDGAHRIYLEQLQLYHELAESKPDHFRLLFDTKDLRAHMDEWEAPAGQAHPVGLVALMEGADGVRSVDELAEWHAKGVSVIGLALARTR